MLVLDTDHLVELDLGSSAGVVLRERLEASSEEVSTTIISAEEQLRGWLAQIHRVPDVHKQVDAYGRLQRRIEFFAAWQVWPWTAATAETFTELRRQRVQIGTMDLKIASIALQLGATLLTRNSVDFAKVPSLRFEDWTRTSNR